MDFSVEPENSGRGMESWSSKSNVGVALVQAKLRKHTTTVVQPNKKFIQSIESKIGSLHDTDSFVRWLDKKHSIIPASEQIVLKRIKQQWQKDLKRMKKDLQGLLSAVRQFAHDLESKSNGIAHTGKVVSI